MSYAGRTLGNYAGNVGGARAIPSLARFLFDTGLPLTIRDVTLDAVCSLLARLDRQNGGYLNAIIPTTTIITSGAIDDDSIGFLMDDLRGRAPAIAVSTGTLTFIAKGDVDKWDGRLEVYVYVLVNSMRSRMSRQRGDVVSAADIVADPGAFVICEHARQLLIGQRLAVPGKVKELKPITERRIATDDVFELWEQHYTVDAATSGNLKRDIALELKAIETYHRLASQADTDPAIVETTTEIP